METRKPATVWMDGQEWYMAGGAAAVLSKRAHRTIKPEYLRVLARLEKVGAKKINNSTTLYLKSDVDSYEVEERGSKAATAMKARAKTRGKKKEVA